MKQIRLKDCFSNRGKNLSDNFVGEILYVDIGSVSYEKGIINKELINFEEAPSRARKIVKNNDIIISTVRTYLKSIVKIEKPEDNLIVSTGFSVLMPKKNYHPKFLEYSLKNDYLQNIISQKSKGVSYPSINNDELLSISIDCPPLTQQAAIANYLDYHTTKIDKEISLLEQKVEKLDEYKQALIYETVTRGLDKNVHMKDSGIEWIGVIPEHWKIIPLKKCLKERMKKNKINDTYITNNILSVMKDIGVINHKDKGDVGNKMSEDISNYKLVYPNDIVINKMNVTIGSLGISKEFGALSVVYMVFKETKGNSNKFFNYLFKCKTWQKYLRTMATGILEIRESVDSEIFFSQPLIVPGVEEQNNIVSFLDEKSSKIDKKKEIINKKIELLQEYKQSLIYEAVTGKLTIG